MAQFGSKDFSTLDRNAALVNDVLATRLKYEAGKAEREKRNYQEQEAATAINRLSEVYKKTHEGEKWVQGKVPGQMEKQKVEVEGPTDAELFQATNEAVARAARLGQPGLKAQEAARDMLYRWTQRKQAKEQFPQSSVDKYEFYLQAAGGDAAMARQMMQRDALGVAQAQPYTGIEVETAEGPKIVQYSRATGKYELIEVPGGAKPSGSGGGGGAIQYPLDTGRETITFKGKTQQDVQSQIRDAKAAIEPRVMMMAPRRYSIDPGDLGESGKDLTPAEDGLYYASIDMKGIANRDPKALKDIAIVEQVLTKEYTDKGMLPEAAAKKAKMEIDDVFKWAAYNRAEANRESQGFGVGPSPLPETGGPTPAAGAPATGAAAGPVQLTPPRADGKVKVQVAGTNPPKIGYIDPSKVDGKKYIRI